MKSLKAFGIGQSRPNCAVIEGVHAEGPIVASLGGLPPSKNTMDEKEFEHLLDSLGASRIAPASEVGEDTDSEHENVLKLMTISPSLCGTVARSTESAEGESDHLTEHREPVDYVALLCRRGVKPCFGHDTNCSMGEIIKALRAASIGLDSYRKSVTTNFSKHLDPSPHITHAFNVQQFHHRNPGLANVALLSGPPAIPEDVNEPSIELIGDGLHVHEATLQLALNSGKPSRKISFVTDGIALPEPGKMLNYGSGRVAAVMGSPLAVQLVEPENMYGTLVGSCAMMLDVFRRLVGRLGVPLGTAVEMCSCTPARIAGVARKCGSLEVGKRADLNCFSVGREEVISLQRTFIAGREVDNIIG